jgi:hypothetical protein
MKIFKIKPKDQISDQQKTHSTSVKINTTGAGMNTRSRHRRIKWLKEIWPDAKSVLCIGARSDAEVQDFLNAGFTTAVGVDVNKAQNLVKQIDAHKIDEHFAENEFDIVYASHSMEHMYDAKKVMQNIRMVAKLGVLMALPHGSNAITPCTDHPTIYDIMLKCPKNQSELESKPELLEDFESLGDFKLKKYHKNKEYADFEFVLEFV